MSFGNSTIFPFPAVQYIPLTLDIIRQAPLNAAKAGAIQPQLVIGPEVEKCRAILTQDYAIALPNAFPPDSLPVLALNLKIDDVKYRGYFVTMIGASLPGTYQLGTIPRRYFYKKNLFFELYNLETAKRLARQSMLL